MNYLEVYLRVSPDFAEILMAELAEIGYESFTEEPDGLKAFIQEPTFDELQLNRVLRRYEELTGRLTYTLERHEKQNWNETWEQNYAPIDVAGTCRVRASFHAPAGPGYLYDLVINPKMSFGTGHHETTALMLEHQLGLDHAGKRVLDVGSGTGILAILAAQRGAAHVSAFDIEEWAVENARENAELNGVADRLTVRQGTIDDEPAAAYDIVLANINRNILLREIPIYATFLVPGGTLLVSGFYETDYPEIEAAAQAAGLVPGTLKARNGWTAAAFRRHEA
jgi:ribosomal protein L11 methyltransferase